MPSVDEQDVRPHVALCVGSDCRKRSEHAPLRSELEPACVVEEVPCLDICKGPVVVLGGDEPIVLAKVRTRKRRRDLLATVLGEQALSERLAAHRVTGKRRKRALKRLRRG